MNGPCEPIPPARGHVWSAAGGHFELPPSPGRKTAYDVTVNAIRSYSVQQATHVQALALALDPPPFDPLASDVLEGDDPMHGKRGCPLGAPRDEQTQQPLDMRHVTHKHDVPRFVCELVGHRFRWIGWLKPARRCVFREGVARAPKRLSGVPGAQLATVPDHRWPDASVRYLLG